MDTTSLCEYGGSSKSVLQNKEYARKSLDITEIMW